MLKILQARLQQYVNRELPDVQAGFRKGRGTRDQIANIPWIIKKAKEFLKNLYFCFIDYVKTFDWVDNNKLENSEDAGNTRPPDLPLENLYAGQEATVRTAHGTTEWFQIGKGVRQGCILSPCLFNFSAEYNTHLVTRIQFNLLFCMLAGVSSPLILPIVSLINNIDVYDMESTSWETLEETQAWIKIAGRNINNPRYADDTTLMAESEEELKSLLRKVK